MQQYTNNAAACLQNGQQCTNNAAACLPREQRAVLGHGIQRRRRLAGQRGVLLEFRSGKIDAHEAVFMAGQRGWLVAFDGVQAEHPARMSV